MVANAFRMQASEDQLLLWFDPSKANLIALLEADHHHLPLLKAIEHQAKRPLKPAFRVAPDPNLIRARKERDAAHAFVEADPKVKLALELFKGEIVHLKELNQDKDGNTHD
ncbi:MAG: hypothetical protein H6510_03445 [Acidobacteria bacterium]|nr:hypothetical protein [Acidobacteriota bacterium]